ncbi:hypothetical protein D3C72_1508940 [compost metagenome]
MLVERSAVIDHRSLQRLVKQSQAFDQRVYRAQHRPGDIVGVDLIAAHHQQGGASLGVGAFHQQAIGAEQAVGGRMMRLAARAVKQLFKARMQDKAGLPGAVVEQVWRPLGDALSTVAGLQEQVIVDLHIAGQRAVEADVDQVHECLAANGDDLAIEVGRDARAVQ